MVAVKNEFVVTWLTITNLLLLLFPNVPPPVLTGVDAACELVLLLPPHASSAIAAIAAALPVSAVRRVICLKRLRGSSGNLRSSHSSRSIASPVTSSGDTCSPPLIRSDSLDLRLHERLLLVHFPL